MSDPRPAAGSEPTPALFYTGDASGQPSIHGIPARDLTDADLERLAFVESTRTNTDVSVADLTKRLADTPLYRKTAPKEK